MKEIQRIRCPVRMSLIRVFPVQEGKLSSAELILSAQHQTISYSMGGSRVHRESFESHESLEVDQPWSQA